MNETAYANSTGRVLCQGRTVNGFQRLLIAPGFQQWLGTPGAGSSFPARGPTPGARPEPEEVTSAHGNRCQGAVSRNPRAPGCLPWGGGGEVVSRGGFEVTPPTRGGELGEPRVPSNCARSRPRQGLLGSGVVGRAGPGGSGVPGPSPLLDPGRRRSQRACARSPDLCQINARPGFNSCPGPLGAAVGELAGELARPAVALEEGD